MKESQAKALEWMLRTAAASRAIAPFKSDIECIPADPQNKSPYAGASARITLTFSGCQPVSRDIRLESPASDILPFSDGMDELVSLQRDFQEAFASALKEAIFGEPEMFAKTIK